MAKVFSSAAAANKRELVIKKESSSPESAAIQSGNFDDLFTVRTLNHLRITGFSDLTSFPGKVAQLECLLQLILTQNGLTTLPNEISALTKLKHLDVSQNQLSTLPTALYELHSLHTLIASHNALTDDSFPTSPESDGLENVFPNLHHVDLLGNRLTKLPEFVYSTHVIQELVASDNTISVLEPVVASLATLKLVDLKRNKLTSLPHELTACAKLKVMRFEENPLSDRRLLKLVAQHGTSKPKAVLDYIASHAPKASGSAGGRGKGGAKKGVNLRSYDDDEEDDMVVFAEKKREIEIIRPAQHVEVTASSVARGVRPYLVCAVVRGVDFTAELAYREFITLQTKLHDTVCKRRRVATIATHNLNKVTPPLRYSCSPASSITFTPLNWTTPMTAEAFLGQLEASKVDKRGGGGKGKKGQSSAPNPVAAALSKYLQFVNGEAMVFLQDREDVVLSLPPLTNSEVTKIDNDTTEMLLEVTSSDSLGACKQVMDALVCGMYEAGVGVRGNKMAVEQVKVVDESGKVLVLYPSRTDLTDTAFNVTRPQ